LSPDFVNLASMVAEPKIVTHLLQLLFWIVGVATTIAGSWIASKIRLYHDDRKSHHQDLKDRVLRPLRDLFVDHQALFSHRVPVLTEKLSYSQVDHARPDQDAVRSGLVLHCNNPWESALLEIDRALFEDANRMHYKKLLAEILVLASSWESHAERCRMWVAEIANDILTSSQMNPYAPPYTPPYVNHLRLGLWIYGRLFHLPTEALRQTNQGKYWSIEGAPTVPNEIGNATLANEGQNTLLLQKIEEITAANCTRASELQRESENITSQAVRLRSRLECEIAKKKLRGHCDLVKFF
jgi:hypothetical protein